MKAMGWILALAALPVFVAALAQAAEAPKPLRVLILSGMNNHDWKSTTPVIEKLFKSIPRFGVVDVSETPEKLAAEDFKKYDVIVSNWTPYPNTARLWPEATEQAFLDYVRNGGGFVVIHAAACTFQVWPEFQEIITLTWKEGYTAHGHYAPFKVDIEDKAHPITQGLSPFWIKDELYHRMVQAFPSQLHVVCKAFSAPEKAGTGKDEPILVTTQFGKGHGANLVLGHDAKAMGNVGFQTLLVRAAEWTATGNVTLPVPAAWPATEADAK